MRKVYALFIVLVLVGLHFYGEAIKSSKEIVRPPIEDELSFDKQTQIPIPEEGQEKIVMVAPTDEQLVENID
jgi:hypothetical protein